MKLWQRYILLEFLKLFVFFLLGLYLLYMVIDYSTHMQDFLSSGDISFFQGSLYYFFQFIKRAELLLPLAFLIAGIRILCSLNTGKELLAFQSAGISMKRLVSPLFAVAACCTAFNFAINEYVAPRSLNFIDQFYDAHLSHSYRKKGEPLHVIHLDDHSRLVYQYYDSAKESFFDVIWIKNADELWKMKYLTVDPDHPTGSLIDHLVRADDGGFEKTESFQERTFADLKWQKDLPRIGYIPFENRAISELYSLLTTDPLLSSYERRAIQTQFLFKLAMPFLTLLTLIAVAPFCTKSRRGLPQFFIYSLALFGFVGFIALMDALVILGESSSLNPFAAILVPFALLFTFFGWRFANAR